MSKCNGFGLDPFGSSGFGGCVPDYVPPVLYPSTTKDDGRHVDVVMGESLWSRADKKVPNG